MPTYVAAIDQGTTSTRCIVFDRAGGVVASAQKEHTQLYPRPGWVEHDAREIWQRTREVVVEAMARADIQPTRLRAVGLTNQRETSIVWERASGRPIANAIVWQDTRTDQMVNSLIQAGHQERVRARTGLPLATYFSAPKVRWLLDNTAGARDAARRGDLLFGTLDSWLIWWLTGGPQGGVHVTDVTNASRTLLMDLRSLEWDAELLDLFGIPAAMLPRIHSSSEVYGVAAGALAGVPIAGDLGDQQAATVGQACFEEGAAKNTYGTGNFMLLNTGRRPIVSGSGLLSTIAYKLGEQAPVYALEGSIAVTGALVQWLRDNLGLIDRSADIEALANTVPDNGGMYFVPAFSGLFAPYWRNDARGVMVGLTRYINRGHVARAALEATAYQTREVLEAMEADSGQQLSALKVDGGMVYNETLMQFQADILGVEVIRPRVAETTALGAAYAAGLATGLWGDLDELRRNWQVDRVWRPRMSVEQRQALYRDWKRAVERSFNWVAPADPRSGD
ncbi:MAG: glycerol kinase GlpK [Chloroflexota bacterium]|nr:glycerol kinase GlpK [Chloroflexota bacterium]